jgi:hypothetical protein
MDAITIIKTSNVALSVLNKAAAFMREGLKIELPDSDQHAINVVIKRFIQLMTHFESMRFEPDGIRAIVRKLILHRNPDL